jgi:NADH-quinone oxidoreductase subunit J
VLVYIGAVAILLMFGIMLTRNIQGDDPTSAPSAWQIPGLVAGLGVFLVLGYGIAYQTGLGGQRAWSETDTRPVVATAPDQRPSRRALAVRNMGKVAGEALMTQYVIAFEVAGLLLTVALVGAIALAHREEEEPAAPQARDGALREPVGLAPAGDGDGATRQFDAGATAGPVAR